MAEKKKSQARLAKLIAPALPKGERTGKQAVF
jgi:hypothetical protein